jgi:hypothetical protein
MPNRLGKGKTDRLGEWKKVKGKAKVKSKYIAMYWLGKERWG